MNVGDWVTGVSRGGVERTGRLSGPCPSDAECSDVYDGREDVHYCVRTDSLRPVERASCA